MQKNPLYWFFNQKSYLLTCTESLSEEVKWFIARDVELKTLTLPLTVRIVALHFTALLERLLKTDSICTTTADMTKTFPPEEEAELDC